MKLKPLPPLKSLVVFEAAARLQSFSAAAEELNVTQGAVSRQIRALETALGKALFARSTRRVDLTPTGRQYYQGILPGLESIVGATKEIVQWQGENRLTVATTNALASLWLLPRIPRFQKSHPDLDIRILASDHVRQLSSADYDIAVDYCGQPPAIVAATPLFPEQVFPVCSPEYLAENKPFDGPQALLGKTLLMLEGVYEGWINWPDWFERLGLNYSEPLHRVNINNYPMVVQAAANGQGIALAWSRLVDDYLDNGTLVRPLGDSLTTGAHFYLLEPLDLIRPKKAAGLFRDWLLRELELH
ncbi:LysR substrate-binding domain-containing protein [Aestuariispira insulae]|uniref:DNA-binding transcriptional LysR family regulator n=1 Tax=Aestuariispira insulae TaxID=1461337 RepID=A0A3D9H5V0_9PROT|nr:LysR substrate-binding domain-containing protein [Aestuariispira insulae]RED44819.1 DNA-binding transcriptional LysR family regulator [Aestuariispira insulae]